MANPTPTPTPTPTTTKPPVLYGSVKYLQKQLQKLHNLQVSRFYRDIQKLPIEDKTTTRTEERSLCFIRKGEALQTSIARILLFQLTTGYLKDTLPSYSEPAYDVQAQRKFKPQLELFFQQEHDERDDDLIFMKGRIKGIRLMNETSSTLTETKLKELAKEIKENFSVPKLYRWHKGKLMASYNDPEKGYKLQILVYDKTDAKEIITKILKIQDHTPDWKFLSVNANEEPTEAYPITAGSQTILGKSRRKPIKRRSGYVTFRYGVLHIWGLPKPIVLFDPSYSFPNALLRK
jgi:hypothetical protein